MNIKQWVSWLGWLALTGGAKSPLRVLDEGTAYKVVRTGKELAFEKLPPSEPAPVATARRFSRGDRVVVNENSGFNKGAHGVVIFQEPNPDGKTWVLRDGASSEAFFWPKELDMENTPESLWGQSD